MRKSFISTDDTRALYGIAILMMIFHHCFLNPARLDNNYISIFGSYETFEIKLAWIGRMCIAIYAFISGYGLSVISKKISELNLKEMFKLNVKKAGNHLLKFYSKFWVVFLLFVPIGILFYEKEFTISRIVRGLLFGEYYCTEWWYVKQYLVLMILFPILDIIIAYITKTKKSLIVLEVIISVLAVIILRVRFWNSFVASVFIWTVNTFTGIYVYIFAIAYIIARFDLFEKIDRNFPYKNTITILGIFGVFAVRYMIVQDAAQNSCDIILGPILIYFLTCFLHSGVGNKFLIPILKILGKYSNFMWLTHTFWLYYYFQPIVLLPKFSILIYLWAVLLSFITAYIMNRIYALFEHNILKNAIKICIKEHVRKNV